MNIHDDDVWAGSPGSFLAVKQAEVMHANRISAGMSGMEEGDDEDNEEEHDLLQVVGDIGLINISGGLVNDASPYLKYYGLTGYPQIKSAVAAAARNTSVKHIVLAINSGGGSVSGCQDTGDLIRMVNDRLKPVTAFTDGTMASAAYWLGSSAGSVYASSTALVGSIGVIATHKEYSKMYAEAGIGVTVVRSGEFKALANSVEPLSDKGREQLQAMVDAVNKVFTAHVSTMRSRTPEYVDATMGQGREFIGAQATDVGLIDGVSSLDALVSKLQQSIDTQPGHIDTRNGQRGGYVASTNTENNMSAVLTEQNIEALKAATGQEAAVDTAAAAPAAAAKEDAKNEQGIAFLNAALEKSQGDVVDLRVKLQIMESQLAEANALIAPLSAIAAKSLTTMRVALGGVEVDASKFSTSQLVAEHGAVADDFTKKFPVGGAAAVDAAQGQKPTTGHSMSALQARQFNAAKTNK